MQNKLLYFFIGTTAELIRISSLIKELKKRGVSYKIVDSGQTKIRYHEVYRYLGRIQPDISFRSKIDSYGIIYFAFWALNTLISATLFFRNEFKKYNNYNIYFVIYGDPVTTSIGAIVARIYGIKIIHIESGDLSGNLLEPFPEEICRNINIRLADYLFPPGKWAERNLKNIKKTKTNTHYNTLADVFWWFMDKKVESGYPNIIGKYYVLIMHRQEHVFFGKSWTKDTLNRVIEKSNPKLTCILFKHPLTENIIKSLKLSNSKNVKIIPPVSYINFLKILKGAEYIASDGATNQYETYLMGKPCILLRNHTEQIEGIGENVILYKSKKNVLKHFLSNYKYHIRKPIFPKHKVAPIIINKILSIR